MPITSPYPQFTPGPWVLEQPLGPDQYTIVQKGLATYEWQFIATVSVGIPAEGLMPMQEAKANARLIATAPDLLAALKGIVGYMPEFYPDAAWEAVKAAISRATDNSEKNNG